MDLPTFDGEPTEERHEHYDADGNFTGSTIVTRPGWSDDARAWALGLALRESLQCPRGHDLTDSLDEDSWKWVAKPPLTCLACSALHGSEKRFEDHPDHRAMLHAVTKVPRPPTKSRG